jgi:hypothetical protein
VATYDPDTGTRQPAGGAHAPGATAVRPGLALLRTWSRAVRSPGLAAVSAIGSVYAVAEMVLLLAGTIDRASALAAFLLVFAPPTLVATLPDTTVLWRVTALVVGLHAGPIVHSPIEQLSPSAFLDSWVRPPPGPRPPGGGGGAATTGRTARCVERGEGPRLPVDDPGCVPCGCGCC